MRILMLSARYLPLSGGTETHVNEVSVRLARRGHNVTILTCDPSGVLAPLEERQGVSIRRLPAYPKGRDWCFAPGVFKAIAAGEWDLMHVQGYHTFLAPLGMLAALKKNLPFVITFHSGGHSSPIRTAFRHIQHRMLAPLAKRAIQLIGVSKFEAKLFSKRMGIPSERFVIVPNGARLPASSSPLRKPLIISLGRLERYKGHHRVLEAFALLVGTHPEMRLRLLGEGPYETALREKTVKLGLSEFVEIGAIAAADRNGMADLLSSAALVVLLSDYEAHPVAVMEALSLNVPVLTTDSSGFAELAEQGLVTAIPLGAKPDRVASQMLATIDAGSIPTSIKLPDWEDCTDQLIEIYTAASGRQESERSRKSASAETAAV